MSFLPKEGDIPVSIPQAYSQLSRSAFSVWILCSHINDSDFKKGRKRLSEICGYSKAQINRIISELVQKGYLRIESSTIVGYPTRFYMPKRPIIFSHENRFYRF